MTDRRAPLVRLGISACLLGRSVRYDGGQKHDEYLAETLGAFVRWVPVCPEVDCGLPVPREPMHLVGDRSGSRLLTVRTSVDHTKQMATWMRAKLRELERLDLCGFVCKSRSPSCGMRGIRVSPAGGAPRSTEAGLFARAFMDRFPLIPMEDEERLHARALRENFIERIFVYRRWRDFLRNDGSRAGLATFHEEHRLLIMAHDPRKFGFLGELLVPRKIGGRKTLIERYGGLLTACLRTAATPAKRGRVLRRAAACLRGHLSNEERAELRLAVERYCEGRSLLSVPTALILHHARRFRMTDLTRQHFLKPHPRELQLRCQV